MNTTFKYKLGLYEKSMPPEISIHEKLKETRKAGFDFMELSIDETDEKLARLKWDREERRKVSHAIWESGVPIKTLCLSGNRKYPLGSESPAVRKRGMEIMEDAIQLAGDLGIRIIQIAGYDEYYAPSNSTTRTNFEKNLKEAVELASREGVILAFETMETDFLNTVSKAMEHIHRIDSPYLQIYPDIGNISNAALADGHSLTLDIAAGRGHMAAMHLKETLPGRYREIPYGTGHVNFQKTVGIVRELGVSLFVGEFWYTGSSNWREDLSRAADFLRTAIRNSTGEVI